MAIVAFRRRCSASNTPTSIDKNEQWNEIPVKGGELFDVRRQEHLHPGAAVLHRISKPTPEPIKPITGARVLAMVGDSVTTDHISPAGSIKKDSPAGKYLMEHGVQPLDFNSYGSRRGNDRVMTRGTFANIRLRNLLAPGTEGGVTRYLGNGEAGEVMPIYDASMKYQKPSTRRWSCWPARITAWAPAATGPPRARSCSA